jgi:hypothetical protein
MAQEESSPRGGTRGAFGAPLALGQIFAQLFITPQARSVQNFGLVHGGVAELQHAQFGSCRADMANSSATCPV